MIGETISHYKILEKLGEGGMGVVYKAHDTKLDRPVALKFLSSDLTSDARQKERFVNEAKSVSSLDHPNICTIYEIDETADGRMFIAMAAYESVSLHQKIEADHLSLDDIIDIAHQITRGLQVAHEKGIVHRDIKSNNILVTNKGDVKIIDFGLAKLRGLSRLTKTGKTVGTLAYMSPEQLRSDEVDNRSDIFSFGVVLYQMLTGKLPFQGEYEEVVMYSIINQDPPPISKYRSGIPEELESIVLKCLEKNPEDRYQNVSEIANELKQLRTSSQTGYRYGTSRYRTSSKQTIASKRYFLPLSVSLLVLIVFIGVLFPNIRQIVTDLIGGPKIPTDIRLAVLPFRVIGDNPDDIILADGLTETIANRITQLELAYGALWVVPASEIRTRDVRSAGDARRIFGANLSLDGSLYRDAQKLFLTLNLVDTKTIRQLRSRDVAVDTESFADLQHILISQTAEMLNIELRPEHFPIIEKGMTKNSKAFQLYIEARGYLQRYDRIDNIVGAISLFEQAITMDPEYTLAYAGLGEAYWRMYEATRDLEWIDRALKSTHQALEFEEDIASIHITLGMIYYGTGEYEKALQSFKRAIEIDSINSEAYRELGRTFEAMGDLDEAEITYKYAVQLRPTYWGGHNRLGTFYIRHNRYKEALEPLRQVIALTPDNSWGYLNLGAVYQYLDQLDEARRQYERALSIAPDYGAASNLGTIYFTEGRYSDAARMYEIALNLYDKDHFLWGNLGSAYYWSPGREQQAKDAYLRAIELAEERLEVNPNDLETIVAVSSYYAAIDDPAKSYEFIQQALSLGLPTSDAMFRLGTTYERLGERDEALNWIEKALRAGYAKSYVLVQPELQELFVDERFQKMIQEIPD